MRDHENDDVKRWMRLVDQMVRTLGETIQQVQLAVGIVPSDIEHLSKRFTTLKSHLRQMENDTRDQMDASEAPLLKRAIIEGWKLKARDIENRKMNTGNRDLLIAIQSEIEPFDQYMSADWFKDATEERLPRLTDYLTVDAAEQRLGVGQLATRVFDDKFHILQAPTLLLKDLAYYRSTCSMRDLPVSVAYIDIDEFKKFNSKHTEPVVDRDVLPPFMRALEAHVYSIGHAYRIGGDEYVVLLPNASREVAAALMRTLQVRLGEIEYVGIDDKDKPTVSIGVCEVREGSMATDKMCEEYAAKAKAFAKQNGRNCIAGYTGDDYDDENLTIIE